MRKHVIISLLLGIFLLAFYAPAFAVIYYCETAKRFSSKGEDPEELIDKHKYAYKLEDMGDNAFISNCSSNSSEEKITCFRYKVDHIKSQVLITGKMSTIKYYYSTGFIELSDFQIFPDLRFLGNSGAGVIEFGVCRVKSP